MNEPEPYTILGRPVYVKECPDPARAVTFGPLSDVGKARAEKLKAYIADVDRTSVPAGNQNDRVGTLGENGRLDSAGTHRTVGEIAGVADGSGHALLSDSPGRHPGEGRMRNTLRVLWSVLWQRRCAHCGRHVRGCWGAPDIPIHNCDIRRTCAGGFAEWGPLDGYLLAGRILCVLAALSYLVAVALVLVKYL